MRDADCAATVQDSFGMDKDHIAIGSFEDEPDDVACWLQHTPEERLAAMEASGGSSSWMRNLDRSFADF